MGGSWQRGPLLGKGGCGFVYLAILTFGHGGALGLRLLELEIYSGQSGITTTK